MIKRIFIVIVVVWRMFTRYLKNKWKSTVDWSHNCPEEAFFISTFTLLILGLLSGVVLMIETDFKILGLLMCFLWLIPSLIALIIYLTKKIKKIIKNIKKEIGGTT